MRHSVTMQMAVTLAVLALGPAALADDVLYSSRLSRRGLLQNGNYNLTIFHVNDVHAHLDQYSGNGAECKDGTRGCVGGYARIKTKVDELRGENPDHLLLDAGDEFQGTPFYTFYGWVKIAEILNDLKVDAITLGNHEWDGGDDNLGNFLGNLTFPVVSCNVQSTVKSLNETIKNYHIFEKYDVAVIGATTETTPNIANVGKGTTFLDPIPEVQRAIYEIRNTTKVKRIIALTHLGYEVDQKLARQTEGLSLIIGGHSHTLLGDMDKAEGKYPTIIKDKSGNEVFVVTSYRWGEYLGAIEVTFDESGRALSYHGSPIHMDNTTALDKGLDRKITAWRGPFEKFAAQVIGSTSHVLDQTTCQKRDCLLGQVVADAMLEYRLSQTTNGAGDKPDFAIINAGGVRATIGQGNITRGQVITAFPFSNAVTQLKYSGADLRKTLEGCVSRVNQFNQRKTSSWFQVSSNIVIEYNESRDVGSRLVNVIIGGKALDDKAEYNVVTVDFVAGGGDNLLKPGAELVTLETLDQVLVAYIREHTPLRNALQKRVVQRRCERGHGRGE
ncbi:5'-nucleotidase precursor [Metarhizium album ARSEF 1941]|uniref:5'-nucleotidase n=1 Tax=Metarhizium album (strain ARSEF 1941) TaxID=1081103 RepID=A0A0B2WTC9_METAS|nr:5'-nucleotidase precursor [Metarhizium album ARSEF 1941]KHN97263.1 5'-nucleotidase precursor [Metarhizium album ARSEF 1941]